MKEFKAGDFTSGKMGEIFRECFIRDGVVINHKQFGKSYLISDNIIRATALCILKNDADFYEFVAARGANDGVFDDYLSLDSDDQMSVIQDYFEDSFEGSLESWFEVLAAL